MKKIISVIGILVAFFAVAFFCWKYFDSHFKEYNAIAEIELAKGDEVYFMDSSFVKISKNSLEILRIENKDKITSAFSAVSSDIKKVFVSQNYFVSYQDDKYYIFFDDGENIKKTVLPEGEFLSAHQFGKILTIKMKQNDIDTVIYTYSEAEELKNITAEVNFEFADYCIDTENNTEYYIWYENIGEYVKLCIRTKDSKAGIEIDNVVYKDFDYINGMFAFYTDNTVIFLNAHTLVRTSENYYDINKLDKFIYKNKYVYYMRNAYFDGVNNILSVNPDSTQFINFGINAKLVKYMDKTIYIDEKYIKTYSFGDSILNDNILFIDESAIDLGVMNDIIAVIRADKIIFMKKSDK